MRRPMTHLAAGALAGVLLVAGCGGSSGSSASSADTTPKGELTSAVKALGDTDALTVTLKLETTAADLQSFAAESKDHLDPATAQKIASAAVVFEVKSDNGDKLSTLGSDSGKHAQVRIAVQDGGKTYAELRALDNTLFLQVDLKDALALFGKANVYGNLQAEATNLPAFAKAAINGQWVSLDLDAAKSLAGQLGAGTASTSPQQSKQLAHDLEAVLDKDVTVTRVGGDDQGDHLQLTGQSRELATDLLAAVKKDVPAAGAVTGSLKATSVPEHSIVLDAWVKDGALSKFSLDVVQFAKPGEAKAGDHLPVVLTFDRSGDDIGKPTDVTAVDISQLFTLFSAINGK